MTTSAAIPASVHPAWDGFANAADVQGHIAQLWVFPVKSCAGVAVDTVRLDATGLAHDREWMVVDPQGVFLTQRSHPRMALIRPQLLEVGASTDMVLALTAPDCERLVVQPPAEALPCLVEVWDDQVSAWDQGDAAAQWLTAFLGTPCRLVRFDRRSTRPCSRKWTGEDAASTYFSDGYPLLLATEAAGSELAARVQAAGGPHVELLRFRANVVLAGLEAHEEDHLAQLHIGTAAGVATLRPVKPCTRCPIPDIDPATAQRSTHVSQTLAGYRADARVGGAITFGMNAIVTQGAGLILTVGQPVAGELAFD
ncbi:MOSC domain-containing protein [Comamonas sp. GB3 AK4-5]|uniref:MOSC domain-containing protein n=1 Tax=Comamonas sp. GB3 AK4-5 TaxID=3231487 RepID=UPI00351EBBBF